MFAAKNPFEDVVIKATSDELTSEDWQLNLDICDRVSSEGDTGARNCVAAIQKRLIHRNANVQLYALTLSDTLSKNCGLPVHQELASRSFTQTLSRISLDRNTHATVKKRCLSLIKQWANDFEDESLDLMRETYDALKQQNADFEDEPEPERPEPSSEQLRAEDEELRRVLELSVQDQGGRGHWVASHPSETAGQSSSSSAAAASAPAAAAAGPSSSAPHNYVAPAQASSTSGYPQASSSSSTAPAAAAAATPVAAPQADAAQAAGTPAPVASRVRALYDFSPTEPGELAFSKGDVIRVLDSVYEHWWRGEVRGEAGIFPVNYVEVLPDPTPDEMRREAEMEARIFSQAANIDLLLSKLRGLDPARDNLTEDEELQELYQTSLAMRPKIVKLIDRYSTKITELKAMNDKFVRARGTFDEMMEQSLARYNPGGQSTQDYLRPRPDFIQHPSAGSIPTQHGQPDYGNQYGGGPAYGQQPQQYGGVPPAGQPAGYGPGPQAQQQPQQPQQQSQDDYAQWYHAQQQQQQPQGQPQHHVAPPQQQPYGSQPHLTPSGPVNGGGPSAASSSTDVSGYQPGGPGGPSGYGLAPPQDDEKRRLYERARAEGEAFQQQYFANAGASGSGAGAAPAPQAYGAPQHVQSPYQPPQPPQPPQQQTQQQDPTAALAQGVAGMHVNGGAGAGAGGY
ncbi:uncharacterized protein PFL1_03791 [Pseudozyma flocculosa PF-1]|uniref:Class E vacuolar protein-sorting machinery protein HSE1 n=2 Tax=Pseudozyma flocculosa TaxID=84751 RepID=A0A5C3EYC8_9BASI|nr:uncharacterized protein PFL1_03791 [Pseudozyma flocculosa PF-1]EPQ28488.1 hypothetical protein PFL1_03791 [Pseudozyma flocculosa PF-1]SPO36407.1 related to Class E vacuolar protein-sorting machinery protein HSE1 [Pseudozyma flocculosa]